MRGGPKQVIGDWSVSANGTNTALCIDTGDHSSATRSTNPAASDGAEAEDGAGTVLAIVLALALLGGIGFAFAKKLGPFQPKSAKGEESMYTGTVPPSEER